MMKVSKMNNERMQVKCNFDEGRMHIQGVSGKVQQGREYGFAVKMRTTLPVSMWLREQPAVLESAASGELMYTPFQIYEYENKVCQMFVPGNSEFNHPQGLVLDLHPMSNQVQKLLRFAKAAGLTTQAPGEPYVSSEEEE